MIPDVFEELNLVNDPDKMICPRCHYEWELRTTKPRKCPNCQVNLYKAREPWPAGYVEVRFRMPTMIPKGWPQPDDPKKVPDMEWVREQSHLAFMAERRMRGQA